MSKDIKIQPLGNKVLVVPSKVEEKTAGGLVIPPTSGDEKRPETGEIVRLGAGKDKDGKNVEFDVKVGDKIYFKKYSPEEIEINGEKYLIIDTEDILAVIK
jgi:chaperonin GroES